MVDIEKLILEVRKFPVLYDQTSDKYRNLEYREKIWNNISTTLEVKGGIEECKKKWSSVRDQLRRTLQKRKTVSGQSSGWYRKYKYEDILEFLLPHLVERDTLSNVPNSEKHQDEDDETETTITNTQEEISDQTYQLQNNRNINEESETDFHNYFTDCMENNFQTKISTTANTSRFEEKEKFFRPVEFERKTFREKNSMDSLASQLMVYILSEKAEEIKAKKPKILDTVKDPVDAFLTGIAPTLKSLNPILLNQAKSKIFSIVQEFEMRQLMSSPEQKMHVPSNFAQYSPSSSPPYPSPVMVETTRVNDPAYYQLDDKQMQSLGQFESSSSC